jgi:hypothetical protein
VGTYKAGERSPALYLQLVYAPVMRSVHYFPRYSQKENVVTNNSLLLLYRLMDHSKLKFEKCLQALCSETEIPFSPAWLRFGQQSGIGDGIVDGFIGQDSVKIVIETKLHEGFSGTQLLRHMKAFQNEQSKLLILLSPRGSNNGYELPEKLRTAATQEQVSILQTSFEALISATHSVLTPQDEDMSAIVDDFEAFCSDHGLLPEDRYLIFVPPCGPSYRDNEQWRLYYCPSDRTRRTTRYLGIYADRQVRSIGIISKVVTCSIQNEKGNVTALDGTDLTLGEKQRILAASRNSHTHGWQIEEGHKFYLCDEWEETCYRKASKGGIPGHRYFDLRKIFTPAPPGSLVEIAEGLREHTWGS